MKIPCNCTHPDSPDTDKIHSFYLFNGHVCSIIFKCSMLNIQCAMLNAQLLNTRLPTPDSRLPTPDSRLPTNQPPKGGIPKDSIVWTIFYQRSKAVTGFSESLQQFFYPRR